VFDIHLFFFLNLTIYLDFLYYSYVPFDHGISEILHGGEVKFLN